MDSQQNSQSHETNPLFVKVCLNSKISLSILFGERMNVTAAPCLFYKYRSPWQCLSSVLFFLFFSSSSLLFSSPFLFSSFLFSSLLLSYPHPLPSPLIFFPPLYSPLFSLLSFPLLLFPFFFPPLLISLCVIYYYFCNISWKLCFKLKNDDY